MQPTNLDQVANVARVCADCGERFVPTGGPLHRIDNWCDGCRADGQAAADELRADAGRIADVQAKITTQLRRDRDIAKQRCQQARRRSAQRI